MCGERGHVLIVVGAPEGMRRRLEQWVSNRAKLQLVPADRDGGFRLALPPKPASDWIENAALACDSVTDVRLTVLPYVSLPVEVKEVVQTLEDLGVTVSRPQPDSQSEFGVERWPSRPPRMDAVFQDQLYDALVEQIDTWFPRPPANEDDLPMDLVCDMLRGLVTHSKMGPNNHSHEDDLWSSRGMDLGPGKKDKIIRELMRRRVLARKPNKSAGGKGLVYWINDVEVAVEMCPKLREYLNKGA